jgi:hypothetical protein
VYDLCKEFISKGQLFLASYVTKMGKPTIVLGWCLLCVILLILYVGLDTKGSFRFQERPGFMNYGMLAEAFISGQLHLKQPVDPERLRSRDPLDPSTPYPFMFDAIIWNGKYYFQHEPLPGFLRAMVLSATGVALPTGAIVVSCALGVFIFLGTLLCLIRRYYFPESPVWMLWYIWLSFALSGIQLYIVSRPVVYHEAVAEGCFFVLAGCTLLVSGLSSARRSFITPCLSGLCFAVAVACRAFLVLYPVCFLLSFLAFSALRRESLAATIGWALSFAAPVALSIAGLFAYNYFRFGDCLDFGKYHVILPKYPDYLYISVGGNFFSWKHVPYHLYHYLLSFPSIVCKFPFLRYPYEAFWINGTYMIKELVCSVFITMPILLLSLPAPVLFRNLHIRDQLALIVIFFGVSSVAVLAVLSSFFGATARYFYDFTPILFVLAFCNLAVFWDRVTTGFRSKTIAKVVLSLLFIGNLLMGLLLGLTGTIQ